MISKTFLDNTLDWQEKTLDQTQFLPLLNKKLIADHIVEDNTEIGHILPYKLYIL